MSEDKHKSFPPEEEYDLTPEGWDEDPETVLKEISADVLDIQLGPSHPAMHGIIKLKTWVEGESIVKIEPEVGYLHRGFEKTCEHRKWAQCIPYMDRLNYVSAPANDIGFCMAVEQMLGVEVPPRAVALRTILMEIARITDHLTCVAASAMELGAFTAFLWLIQAREFWYFFLENYCGARVTTSLSRIGGMPYDVYDGFYDDIRENIKRTRQMVYETHVLLTKNRIFYDRTRGTGAISKEEAIDWGFGGPVLRSTGVEFDLRKARPYLLYDQLEFDVPTGKYGDNYDRYIVRMEEIEQSCRIIEQVLPNIPDGPLNVEDPHVALVDKDKVYNSIEGIIYHFKLLSGGHQVPKGEHYFAIEAPNGELGFYLVSDGSGMPYRMRVRPACMFMTAALPEMLKGEMIPDIVPTFGSINMIGGELER